MTENMGRSASIENKGRRETSIHKASSDSYGENNDNDLREGGSLTGAGSHLARWRRFSLGTPGPETACLIKARYVSTPI